MNENTGNSENVTTIAPPRGEAAAYDDPQLWHEEGWDTVITLYVPAPWGEMLMYPVQDFVGGDGFIIFGQDSYDRYTLPARESLIAA